jgi:hypothetical protein
MANSKRQYKRHTPERGEKGGICPRSGTFLRTFRILSGSWDVQERNGRRALTFSAQLRHSCGHDRLMRQLCKK